MNKTDVEIRDIASYLVRTNDLSCRDMLAVALELLERTGLCPGADRLVVEGIKELDATRSFIQ